MAAHACVYHSVSPPYRLSFFLPSTARAFSLLPLLPAFLPLFLRRSPSASLFNIWVALSPLSQCFGSFACPEIVPAAL